MGAFLKVGGFEPTQTHPWPRHWGRQTSVTLRGGGGSDQCDTLWQGGGGVKIGQKKRYVIVERPQTRF